MDYRDFFNVCVFGCRTLSLLNNPAINAPWCFFAFDICAYWHFLRVSSLEQPKLHREEKVALFAQLLRKQGVLMECVVAGTFLQERSCILSTPWSAVHQSLHLEGDILCCAVSFLSLTVRLHNISSPLLRNPPDTQRNAN